MKLFKALLSLLLIGVITTAVFFSYKQVERLIYPREYSELVGKYSSEYSLDENFVFAVIKCESSFDPLAVSSDGARGLMQLMPDTFDWVNSKLGISGRTHEQLFDPQTNIQSGTYLLRLHIDEFGSYETALAAYHAGRNIVNQWLTNADFSVDGEILDKIPYKDTSSYVDKVMKTYDKYNKIYGGTDNNE